MAGTLLRLKSAVIVAVCISFQLFFGSEASGLVSISGDFSGGVNRQLILPLSHSPSRRVHRRGYRRHLEKAGVRNVSNARMPLFDDLLRHGYYTTRLYIGSPPQEFALIVDTGSTVTYVPCSTCENCGKHQDPRFQPELSGTYQTLKCNPDCTCDEEGEQCTYERRYAEMSSSSGVLAEDVISFGNRSQLVPQHVVFGCENVETGDLYSQRADGIMGLGRGPLSIMDQLVDKGVIGDSFSLCYGGMDIGGGAMILGAQPSPSGMVFTHSDPYRSPYYNIELKGIHVAGKPLKLDAKVFDGKHGTVLDSGTTYAYFPQTAFSAFKDAIFENTHPLKQIPGPDPNYGDICFAGAGRDPSLLSEKFPAVDMVFSNGRKLQLSPENYLFRHTKVHGAYCLGIFQNGNDQTTLLGGIVVRNTLVTYDRANERIGFRKTNCSELWKGQQLDVTPAEAPLTSQRQNKTAESPSVQSPAPGGLEADLMGDFPVGQITFDMSFPGANSSLMSKLTRLSDFIAKDLGINASQVHLVNLTFRGNNSLAKWAIDPINSSSYISDPTAKSIIVRLSEHHMELPGVGNYEVVGWKVQPQSNGCRKLKYRKVSHQHLSSRGSRLSQPPRLLRQRKQSHRYLGLLLGGVMVLFFASSSIGLWLFWRRSSQSAITYQPVSLAAPDQGLQLQPL